MKVRYIIRYSTVIDVGDSPDGPWEGFSAVEDQVSSTAPDGDWTFEGVDIDYDYDPARVEKIKRGEVS